MAQNKKARRSPGPAPSAAVPRSTALAAFGMLLTLAVIAVVAWIETTKPAVYLRIVQEDEILEWGTVWAFLGATAFFFLAAYRRMRAGKGLPWFLLGVGLFCFTVAGEEISWGQRLLGYRPPSYFLEHNYQQELNVHNVLDKDLRKSAVSFILLGYGLMLPGLALFSGLRRLLERLRIEAPSAALTPAFLATFVLYDAYPWDFTGEVVELAMGLGFLFAGMCASGITAGGPKRRAFQLIAATAATALVFLLGWANAVYSSGQRSGNPESVTAAGSEIEALRRDFQAMADANRGRPVTRCGLHKRVYTYVEQYDKDELLRGAFASLTAQGLPEDRAAYFIDPWNSPYWIRHRCDKDDGRVKVFVYSFGPNRRRDSDRWNILGDDVGTVIYERGR
ncbi:MAG: hypothetical protein KDD47_13820 [Acidobacteria bacterium]|nr:hypothetical protein [Acidobacteriota bacterium]